MSQNPHDVAADAPISTGRRVGRGALIVVGLWLVAALVLPYFSNARNAARRNACRNQAKLLGVALLSYHEHYGSFPPAYVADAGGKPMHSWRVLLMPFMCGQSFNNEYHLDEPWDGPNNRQLAAEFPTNLYRCPSAEPTSMETNYVAVVGPETMWPGGNSASVADISDRASQTIMLVEVANSGIHWGEPRDMTLDEALQGINSGAKGVSIASKHADGATVVFADGHVDFLPNDLPKEKLRALLTANGGEDVSDPDSPQP